MLARLQQAITLTLLCLALGWAAWFAARGQPAWALVGALLIVFGYAIFLAIEFVLLAATRASDPAPRASAAQLLRAWWGEVLAAPRVFCWRQPFRSHAEPDALDADSAGRLGVLLVHGFVCNRALWNPWLARLRAAGVPFVAVSLEPVFGAIDDYGAIIDDAVLRLQQATGRPPLVVAHSMGGLAVRAWLARRDAAARVHHVVTIATPHRGTWLARFALSPNGHQMQIGGPWLRELEADERARRGADPYTDFTCLYSHCDNIVFPPSTATLPGAANKHVAGSAHVHLAFQPEAFSEVWARLATAAAATPALAR